MADSYLCVDDRGFRVVKIQVCFRPKKDIRHYTGILMDALAHAAFALASIAFVASWAVAAWNIARVHLAIRRDGRLSLRASELFDTKSEVWAYPEARRFMRAMLAGLVSWCFGLAIGLGTGILH